MPTILSKKSGGSGGGGAPSGPAGGDLAGTYPNPTISSQASADGFVLTSDGAGGTAFERPPGYEWDYAQDTDGATVTATTEGTANTIVSGNAVTYDGAPVILEYFMAAVQNSSATTDLLIVVFDGSSAVGTIARADFATVDVPELGGTFRWRFTPTAAAHTYSIRGYMDAASTATIYGGAAGAGAFVPIYMRITKV